MQSIQSQTIMPAVAGISNLLPIDQVRIDLAHLLVLESRLEDQDLLQFPAGENLGIIT